MIDNKTQHLALPLPHRNNVMADDVERIRAAFEMVDSSLSLASSEIDAINVILQSDDTELDQFQELVAYIKQNKTLLSQLSVNNIAGLASALAGKASNEQLAELSATQSSLFTSFDSMPLFSISPPGYYHGGMSEKWTIANGAGITIADYFTQQQVDDYLASDFVTNWNASVSNIDTATVATIRQESGLLYIPDLISWAAYFATSTSSGGIVADAIRNITASMDVTGSSEPKFGVMHGAFAGVNEVDFYSKTIDTSTSVARFDGVRFDASRVVPTAAVNRPQTLQYIPYFKIK